MTEALVGLLGVIVGALITGISEYITNRISRRKRGEYLAIRVVAILDNFVSHCVHVVLDDGLCHGQRDEDGCRSVQAQTPDFTVDSLDVDWNSIPSGLMYEILSMSNYVITANEEIDGVWEYMNGAPDFEELFDERHIQYSELGLKAASLADELRKTYKIPAREYTESNPIQHLLHGKKRALENKRQRNSQAIAFQKQIFETD